MKQEYTFMINGNFKATMKAKEAEWLKPAVDAGEFILESNLAKATLVEVAQANKVEVDTKLGKDKFYVALITQLNKIEKGISIMSDQPISQQVDKIITDGVEAKKGKWIIIAAMSEVEGINQAKLESMYKESTVRLGFEIDPKAVKAKLQEFFDAQEIKEDMKWADVDTLVANAVKAVEHSDDKSALALLRRTTKSLFEGIKDWKFPKKSGGGKKGTPGGLFQSIIKWVGENRKANGDDLVAFLQGETKSEERIKNMTLLVSGLMSAYNKDFVPATPVEPKEEPKA